MPINRFLLIAGMAVIAAGGTVWLGLFAAARFGFEGSQFALVIPAVLAATVALRLIVRR